VPVVREMYPRLKTKHGRTGALRLLANIGTREAEETIVDLCVAHQGEKIEPGIWFAWAGDPPNHVDVLFPRVLDLLGDETHTWGVLSLILGARRDGTLNADDLVPLVAQARELRRKLRRRQRPEPGPWSWKDDYVSDSGDAEILVDLLGRCGGPAAVKELRASLKAYTDPLLHAWTVASLVRLDEEVDPREVGRAAERPESRSAIVRALQEKGRLTELPEHLRSPDALAEAEMVDWLTHPNELAHPPEAIELEGVFTAGDHGEVHLFRFRDEGEWHAGIAGGPLTFSDFEPWDSRSPQEHVQAIVDGLPL
jgi:hypothetical protein